MGFIEQLITGGPQDCLRRHCSHCPEASLPDAELGARGLKVEVVDMGCFPL